ncbi:stage II sporulation protein R [Bacillus sp. OG2]|nr:stage II sporulation protein R [Bacillus sp. OG2]
MTAKSLAKLYIIILSLGTMLSLYIPKTEVAAEDPLVIPQEAIRLRILANSDSEGDQALKRLVRDAVNKEITEWVSELTSIEEARSLIKSRLPEIQEIAENVVEEENSDQTVKANFGKVDFPTKLYGQFLYPAGEYEAILITLGEGDGANWWCVLFPPLCFLDFSNGVAVSDGFEEENQEKEEVGKKELGVNVLEDSKSKEPPSEKEPVFVKEEEEKPEVKFFIKELWDKIFG